MTLLRRLTPQIIALLLILAANAVLAPGFLNVTFQNGRFYGSLVDILVRGAPVGILAVGMTLVIASRGIDLSVGAVMAISGATAAALILAGYPLSLTLAATLAAGIVCGIWNGFLVALLRIQPIVATLILMVAGRGIAQLITEGAILTFNNPGLSFIGSGAVFGIPMPVLILAGFAMIVGLTVRQTALGLMLEAIGINRTASALAGVRTGFLIIAVYALSGLGAAIAGVITAADIRGADANNAGLWLELDAILAVVIGGNSLLGGRFSIIGSLIGAMIIQSINTGILMAGYPPEFNLIIKAGIIIVILALQSPALRTFSGWFRSTRPGIRKQETASR